MTPSISSLFHSSGKRSGVSRLVENQFLTNFSYKWFCEFRSLMLICSYFRVCHTHPRSQREHLPCMQSPSVQFLDCSTSPSQSFPPFLGAGAVHSLRRQCVHSVPQVDHLLQDVHLPSTETRRQLVRGTQKGDQDRAMHVSAQSQSATPSHSWQD